MGAIALEQPTYTHADYLQTKSRCELINGEFYDMAPAPYPIHQLIVGAVYRELEANLTCKEACAVYISPIDWKIDEHTIVQPDVAIFCEKTDKQYFSQTPPVVVEVLSPSTTIKDLNVKFKLYEKTGVKWYVIAEPTNQFADIFELRDGTYHFVRKVLHGDKIKLEWDENCLTEIDFTEVFSSPEEMGAL